MNFFARLLMGLQLIAQAIAMFSLLETVGGELESPAVIVKYQGREFELRIKVKRVV